MLNRSLFDRLQEFVALNVQLERLKIQESLVKIGTNVFFLSLSVVFLGIALIFANVALSFFLNDFFKFPAPYVGFALTSAFWIALLLFFMFFKKALVRNTERFLMKNLKLEIPKPGEVLPKKPAKKEDPKSPIVKSRKELLARKAEAEAELKAELDKFKALSQSPAKPVLLGLTGIGALYLMYRGGKSLAGKDKPAKTDKEQKKSSGSAFAETLRNQAAAALVQVAENSLKDWIDRMNGKDTEE